MKGFTDKFITLKYRPYILNNEKCLKNNYPSNSLFAANLIVANKTNSLSIIQPTNLINQRTRIKLTLPFVIILKIKRQIIIHNTNN